MAVTSNGQPVELSKKTFDLLYYMASNQGKLLERQELINNVWEHEYITPRTVDVHIRKLRSKFGASGINADPLEGFIKTIQGRGYQLVEKVIVDDDFTDGDSDAELSDGISTGVHKDQKNRIIVVLNVCESKYGNMVVYVAGSKWMSMPVKDFKAIYKKVKQ